MTTIIITYTVIICTMLIPGLGPSPDLKPFAEKGLSLQA